MKEKEEKLNLAVKVIDQWLEYQRYSSRISSLSYAVTHKGKELTSGAYGYADLDQKFRKKSERAKKKLENAPSEKITKKQEEFLESVHRNDEVGSE